GAAAEAYDKALHLRRELGQHGLAIDDLAGLTRISLAQAETKRALAQADEILAWIDANGTGGIEYPLQVYLTCYLALQEAERTTANQERAGAILVRAHAMLMEQAARISNEELRLTFLENVKTNREILAIWQARKGGTL
ncbi:MAG: hypothetical protein JXA89_23965, partial [Anaerolineae bacterium]|nr:hypothetical protein [Anaerolineae bacterium]